MKYDSRPYETAYRLYWYIMGAKGIPDKAPYSKKQEKIIREVINTYIDEMPEEQRQSISTDKDIEEVLLYLKECSEKCKEIEKLRTEYKCQMLEKLGVSEAIFYLGEIENINDVSYMYDIKREEFYIKFELTCNCEKTLVLENVRVEGDFDFTWDMEDYWEISECYEGYRLEYYSDMYSVDKSRIYVAYFTSARIDNKVYSAMEQYVFGKFSDYVVNIIEDVNTRITRFNVEPIQKEKQMLSLFEFFSAFYKGEQVEITEEVRRIFSERDISYDIEKIFGRDKKDKLDSFEYEPFWRDMYAILAETQCEYESRVERYCERDQLLKVRSEIDKTLKDQGFGGKYPDYSRYDDKKEIFCYVKCVEVYDDFLQISFLCGGITSKKKHYHSNLWLSMVSDNEEEDTGENMPSPREYAIVAAKLALKQRLTGKEKKNTNYFNTKWKVATIIKILLFIIVCFGSFMSIGMMFIVAVGIFIFTLSFDKVIDFILETSWLNVVLQTGVVAAIAIVVMLIFGIVWSNLRKN